MSANQTPMLLTGNHAVAWAARLARPQVVPVYPITPQTPILELLTDFQAAGEFDAEIITPESEHSVMSACIPASLAGVRVFTATASQGLLLMHELLHYASGARAPIVMANVNRTVASPWAFWPDQTDSLAQRDTGWIQFYVESAQECARHRAAGVPRGRAGAAAGDGEPRRVLRLARARAGAGAGAGSWSTATCRRTRRCIGSTPASARPGATWSRRTCSTGIARRSARRWRERSTVAQEADREWGERTGRSHGLLERYRCDGARTVIVTMGSMCGTAREAVDAMRDAGQAVGPAEGAAVPAAAGAGAARGAGRRARRGGARPQPFARRWAASCTRNCAARCTACDGAAARARLPGRRRRRQRVARSHRRASCAARIGSAPPVESSWAR